MPAMFAPVHDLARHIQIVNTYWREAEYVGDPLHMVLWEVMDDLVETHARLSPKSLFAGITSLFIFLNRTDYMYLTQPDICHQFIVYVILTNSM